MSDFKTKGNKLIKYEGSAKSVEIPAFKGCVCEITYSGIYKK